MPQDPSHYTLRALAFARLGDQKGAIADFTSAIRLDPRNPER
jgi:Flp pilus assembly protein TadD